MNPVTDDLRSPLADDPWLVLVIDDEPEVHTITRLALRDCEFNDRRLEFLSARSAEEARRTLARHPDIALAFIDVVMETEHAGLDLVTFIRQVLGNETMRLILRTGQAGAAPERQVIRDFDVNDYLTKTGVSSARLYTATVVALRAHAHLVALRDAHRQLESYRGSLESLLEASAALFQSRSMAELVRELPTQLARVLRGGDVPAPADGVVLRADATGLEPLGASGCFDQPGAWPLPPRVLRLVEAGLAAGQSLTGPEGCVAHLPRAKGGAVLVYLDTAGRVRPLDLRMIALYSRAIALAFDKLDLEHELGDAQAELVTTLSTLLAMRSVETGNHVRRVAHLSRLLARQCGLPEAQCQTLFTVAPMHDIGKFAIPEEILAKPMSLTDAEWLTMRDHARLGASLFAHSDKPLLQAAAIVAGQHHEWYDGSGYPQGLRAQGIHLFARIVAVVDAFDALSHRRCYKPAWEQARVEEELRRGRGTHFDPDLVDLLLARMDEAIEILRSFPEEGDPDWITAPTGARA